MKFRSIYFLLTICHLLFSCGEDDEIFVDLSEFEQITERYPYWDVTTKDPVNYWELVFGFFDSNDDRAYFESGSKCSDSNDKDACILEFDSISSYDVDKGFQVSLDPYDDSHYYIKAQQGENISVIKNANGVKSFLGEIDTESDAILLAFASGYEFSIDDKKYGAIRVVPAGYQMLVTRWVDICPETNKRFLLEITTAGEIVEVNEETIFKGDCDY